MKNRSAFEQINDQAFWGLSGQIVRAIQPHSEADPMALLVQLITAFGNAIGRNPHFMAEADEHHSNLFVVCVGDSAKARKGSSWGYIERLMAVADPGWIQNCVKTGLASGEGLIWHLRDDRAGDYNFSGVPSGDKRLLSIEPEFASILKVIRREGNILSPILRSAWDGKTLQSLTKNEPIKVSRPHISVVAHITKLELLNYVNHIEVANGLLNRFLFFYVQRSKCLPEGGNLPAEDLELMGQELKASIEFASKQGLLQRDILTKELWKYKYPKLSEGMPGVTGSLSARSEAQVMRLSLVLSLLNRKDHIEIDCMNAAFALHEYSKRSLDYIFGRQLGNLLADQILEYLESEPQGLTRTQINQRLSRNYQKTSLQSALDLLRESGWAFCKNLSTDGRPIELWKSIKYAEQYEINEISTPTHRLNSFISSSQEDSHG